MVWTISTRNMPRLHSYEAAAKFYGESKPFRQDPASAPLDNRRMFHKRLLKIDGGYACILYGTAVVTYYLDEVQLRCHDSVSTTSFADQVSPRGCTAVSHKGQMYWRVLTDDGDCYYRPERGMLRLKRTAAGNWRLLNKAAVHTEWTFDRKRGALARKLVQPYRTWFEISKRVGMALPNYVSSRDYLNPTVHKLLAQPDAYTMFPALARDIGPPVNALHSAYLILGARVETPVPHDRLPRN